tara:strand:+ start:1603 stop:2217 length:615 start_codon:yes stop_codon:yes gene_type:complete
LIKILFDFLTSFIGLVLLLPFFIIISSISIVFQGFPVFFLHKRLGKNGIIFTIIKFRTMANGPSESAEHDITRLTRWGRFLRKTSIDELPVLLNVIKGDMSLVGPRPLPVKYLPRFNSFQKKRMNVKPGITGLAQAHGRNQLSWEERFDFDIQYTKEKSFFLDLSIIIKTLYLVIFRKNIEGKSQEIMPEFMGSITTNADDQSR